MTTTKEIQAGVMVVSAFVISAWVAWDATHGGLAASLPEAAWEVVWAIGYSIGFNILAVIVSVIVASILQGEELKDEAADERDRMISDRSMRNAYFVLSIGVLGVLIWQGLGLDVVLGPYALFGISMLAGATFGVSQLYYYRMG